MGDVELGHEGTSRSPGGAPPVQGADGQTRSGAVQPAPDENGAGRVIVLGSLNADVFARVARHPAPGETILGRGGESRPGGKGANQAAAAAFAGAPVMMIGAVGDDPHAQTALRGLQRAGADTTAVRAVDVPTGLALITVSADGENSIIVIPGANDHVGEPELIALRQSVRPTDFLVLQGEIRPSVAAQAAQVAADAGARVIINLAPVVDYPAEALRLADLLVVNEHEALGALSILRAEPAAPVAPRAHADVVAQLLGEGVRAVVMTLGGEGALVAGQGAAATAVDPTEADATDSAEVVQIAPKKVTVVDTTGAGDAFVGALAARLVRGDSLAAAAEVANGFAAEAVQHEGAQDAYPDWRTR